jgi:hypothetical protein
MIPGNRVAGLEAPRPRSPSRLVSPLSSAVVRGPNAAMLLHATRLDPTLRFAERFELDPASRKVLLKAQAETRRQEGTTPEQNVALCVFSNIV